MNSENHYYLKADQEKNSFFIKFLILNHLHINKNGF